MRVMTSHLLAYSFFFFQAEDGIRDYKVTGVQTCALPISARRRRRAPSLGRRPRDVGIILRGLAAVEHAVIAYDADAAEPHALGEARRGRSGERRVGEEGRSRWAPDHLKKKKKKYVERRKL